MSRILAPPVLPSFPTRRSSDLPRIKGIINALYKVLQKGTVRFIGNVDYGTDLSMADLRHRSEEHTSELQSRGHLVCRLLLEKKKHDTNSIIRGHHGEDDGYLVN